MSYYYYYCCFIFNYFYFITRYLPPKSLQVKFPTNSAWSAYSLWLGWLWTWAYSGGFQVQPRNEPIPLIKTLKCIKMHRKSIESPQISPNSSTFFLAVGQTFWGKFLPWQGFEPLTSRPAVLHTSHMYCYGGPLFYITIYIIIRSVVCLKPRKLLLALYTLGTLPQKFNNLNKCKMSKQELQ